MRELTTELMGPAPSARQGEYKYFHGNFQERLKPGQGVEMIYELLGQAGPGSRWLDLGAGPFSALWGVGLPMADQLVAVDESPLNLWLNNRYWTDLLDGDYATSLVDAGLASTSSRDRARSMHRRYLLGDLFQPPSDRESDDSPGEADIVTAIGLLGLARGSVDVASLLGHVGRATRSGGMFVGASWLRHDSPTPAFAVEWPDRLAELGERGGLHLQDSRQCTLAGDAEFATVFGWTMRVREN